MTREDYIHYTFSDYSISTLQEFVSGQNLTSIVRGWNVLELLAFEDEFGITNLDKIYQNYNSFELTIEDEANYNFDKVLINSPSTLTPKTSKINIGTVIGIPINKLVREILIGEGTQIENKESDIFFADSLKTLLKDINYFPIRKVNIGKQKGIASLQSPEVSIFLWSRSFNTSDDYLEGTFLNITPFIQKVDTSVSGNGGNFSLDLAPIECYYDLDGVIKIKNIQFVKNGNIVNFVSQNDISNFDGKKPQYFFHNIVNENDIVFIRFENLMNEKQRLNSIINFVLNGEDIIDNVYDMIGLVDASSMSLSPAASSTSITVSGRDMFKLLIEDGCYFFPLDFVPGGVFANEVNELYKQRIDGKYYSLSQSAQKSVGFALKFIFNALSNIGICSDSTFSAYGSTSRGDVRSKQFDLKTYDLLVEKNEELSSKYSLEKKIKSQISLSTTEINEVFNEGISYIRFLIQNNLILFFEASPIFVTASNYNGEILTQNTSPIFFKQRNIFLYSSVDTTGNSLFDIDATNQQVSPNQLFVDIYNYINKDDSLVKENPLVNLTKNTKGIWQIIKLVLDDEVEQRRLVDSTIGNENGSILNHIQKVCQAPFCEFGGDTYGDQFFFYARSLPFTKVKIKSAIEEGLILDIFPEDILQESYNFSSNEAYSWYRITGPDILGGGGGQVENIYIKAVHFKEYMDIWGDKPYDMVSNYIPYFSVRNTEEKRNIAYLIKQLLYDLKYLIETTCYLPFTREGQIVLKGDRRIKRGTWIRNKSTGELFYVEGVSQQYKYGTPVVRTTTLSLKRGMVEKHLDFYFKIINLEINDAIFQDSSFSFLNWIKETSGKWKVDPSIFNFFLKRKQFSNLRLVTGDVSFK